MPRENAGIPEPVPLEQHPDPLPPLGHAVEAPVEIEVLERGELAVHERLVREEADLPPLRGDLELPASRGEQAGQEGEKSRLSGPVRPGDDDEIALLQVEVEPREGDLVPEPALERAGSNHASTSRSTKAKKAREMTPFIVKKARSRRRRSSGETRECS
jgi:hypothetical protein